MTTGKNIALTRWTFVGKVMSLLLNMLSRLVKTFLPRSKRLLLKIFIFTLFYFTVLYWFCHTLTWIHHGCTCVPKHEPPSHLFLQFLFCSSCLNIHVLASSLMFIVCVISHVFSSDSFFPNMFVITCTPVVDSCQCMAKPIQYCKKIK